MSERFAQDDEWPGPGVPIVAAEPTCGVWNTVAILAGAVGLGIALGVVGYFVWRFFS